MEQIKVNRDPEDFNPSLHPKINEKSRNIAMKHGRSSRTPIPNETIAEVVKRGSLSLKRDEKRKLVLKDLWQSDKNFHKFTLSMENWDNTKQMK